MRTKRDSITDNFECVTVVWEFATCIDCTPVNNNCLESNVNVGKQPNTNLKIVHVFQKFPEVHSAAVLHQSMCVFFGVGQLTNLLQH